MDVKRPKLKFQNAVEISLDTAYQAQTDIEVSAYAIFPTTPNDCGLQVKTGTTNPPTTIKQKESFEGNETTTTTISISYPVAKGLWFKVEKAQAGSPLSSYAEIIPIS